MQTSHVVAPPVLEAVGSHGSRTALITADSTHRYSDVVTAAAHVSASILTASPSATGKRVMIMTEPSATYARPCSAYGWRGAIAVPVLPGVPRPEIDVSSKTRPPGWVLHDHASTDALQGRSRVGPARLRRRRAHPGLARTTLRDWDKARLVEYTVPHEFLVVEALPPQRDGKGREATGRCLVRDRGAENDGSRP